MEKLVVPNVVLRVKELKIHEEKFYVVIATKRFGDK